MFPLTFIVIPTVAVAILAYMFFCVRRLEAREILIARPGYYFGYAAVWTLLPIAVILFVWDIYAPAYIADQIIDYLPPDYSDLRATVVSQRIPAMAAGEIAADPLLTSAIAAYHEMEQRYALYMLAFIGVIFAIGFAWMARRVRAGVNPRASIERFALAMMFLAATISVLTTIGIVMSVLFETIRFFERVPITEFLFGTNWSPQTALRADQIGSSGAFGSVPLFVGTLLISAIALAVAVPIGLICAIYLSEYATERVRGIVKPLLEILAGIPTVVYGFFAALLVAPFLQDVFGVGGLGFDVSSESALAAGLVMGIMLIPFVSSLSDDVLNAVPRSLYEGSLAVGATRLETIFKVMVPAAFSGITSSVLLAASRAIGETMIVVMAVGLAAHLTLNPLDSTTTVTVQIQSLLVGDQEFDSAKTLSAFALGFMLLLVTLAFNMLALHIIRRYREIYD